MNKPKLLRITTVPQSLRSLLKGQLKFMSENGWEVIGVSTPNELLDEVSEVEGIRTIGVNMTRTISPIQDLKSLFQLIRLIRKEKPQIVHTHTPKAGLLGMMAARICGVPHRLHTVAGMPLVVHTGVKRKILNATEKLTYACATRVYPNSYGLQEIILANKFIRKNKLKVIGHGSSNGIDTSEFDPELFGETQKSALRKELNIQPDEWVFVFVGRMVGDKGVNELVEAFVSLNAKNAKLLLVGPLEADLDPLSEVTLAQMERQPDILSVGFQQDVRPYFGIADVLVFPSYREGFPNVVMQAAAMQLNCIVTDINGCNEIITQGENGWIVPVKEVEALKSQMQWSLENRDASKAMGLKSRKLMIEKYERKFVQQEILKEYERVLGVRD